MKYYVYHIPGIKYGATKDMEYRAKAGDYVNLYGPNSWTIVATCNTAEEADELERRLNIEAGYEWNESRSYLNMLAFAARGGRKPNCEFSDTHRQALSRAKLQPPEIVEFVRRDLEECILSQRAIAKKYKISRTSVSNIRDRKKGY